jgi:hypothetical protein
MLLEAGPCGRPRVRDCRSRRGRLGAGGLRLQGRSGAWWRQAGYLRRSTGPARTRSGGWTEVTLGNKIVLSSINREKCGTHIGVNCREMSDGWRRVIMLVSRLQLQTCKLDHGSKYVQIKKGQIRPGFLPLLFCQTLCLCDQLPDPHRKSSASNSNSKKISYYISIKSNKKSSLISREIIKINIYT